jgi:hypothetical protein
MGNHQQHVISRVRYQVLGMETTILRVEYRLDGASNFLSWKTRENLTLKEYDLWELVDKVVTPPTDLTTLEAHNKKDIKSDRVLLMGDSLGKQYHITSMFILGVKKSIKTQVNILESMKGWRVFF